VSSRAFSFVTGRDRFRNRNPDQVLGMPLDLLVASRDA
jgi:hypothetical protein